MNGQLCARIQTSLSDATDIDTVHMRLGKTIPSLTIERISVRPHSVPAFSEHSHARVRSQKM